MASGSRTVVYAALVGNALIAVARLTPPRVKRVFIEAEARQAQEVQS